MLPISLFGRALGLRNLWRRDGLRMAVEPITYWRTVEIREVLRALPKGRILDIGSPKLPSLYLAVGGSEVFASDLFPYFTDDYGRYARQLQLGDRYHILTFDARKLPFPNAHFDAVYSISTVEHIEGDGDSVTMAEVARVLRPDGVCVLTVPFAMAYRESTSGVDLYYKRCGEFYERHYDRSALQERLVAPSGLRLRYVRLYRERIGYHLFYKSLPRMLKFAISPFSGLAGACFLRETSDEEAADTAVLVLDKR